MSAAAAIPVAEPISIPLREILPWAALLGLMALLVMYFIGAEQGGPVCRLRPLRARVRPRRPPPPRLPLPLSVS